MEHKCRVKEIGSINSERGFRKIENVVTFIVTMYIFALTPVFMSQRDIGKVPVTVSLREGNVKNNGE